ncbi:uncharacterized protein SPPG_04470 [Spizellomyces punctatus DAOM BR117]|uniref:NADH dehydrogenase [ubiquinone] iron-sulfur protein 4, mitochondrial n=1 Tax=Spizellomyces punctatus (strain DAOM BR117) TaxID=645134 RepID=A0A0L0HGC3_SPIPD|nr:uncharacterized protein SPPG_04470 [Spizellomyces punctatus DAOM BR117]KND00128.1 hypothetical protein SPPG_04470 [Spizellomyces punctatus DAOM BR117]|eukprot:XP_016608167.1 hypothetical protein SPPG_04470 [Spizellomyces punctatus DAOM BR117]
MSLLRLPARRFTGLPRPTLVYAQQIRLVSSEKLQKLSGEPLADKEHENLVIPSPKGQRDVFEADACSGVPPEISRRSVKIFKPARNAMQQGTANSENWRIDFDVQERWENPLMGWASSHDAVQGVRMNFASKEDAILFAERQGYEYWVEEPKPEKFRVKTYADNFKYVPGKLRMIKTK